ncbi:MAG: putative diaminopimelate dehydrogenase [Nitrospira sp.]|nr:MAG: putative diaminopimelate dehydrogenase [Nitrospira sp.]
MSSMKPLRLAVVGFGKVGRVCAELISLSHDLSVAAIVRRAASVEGKLPETLRSIPVTTHIGQARDVDAALLCVPTNAVEETAEQILRRGIPIIECAKLQGAALHAHKEAMHKLAIHHKTPAIVGAGWDPGALSVFRSWFALLAPGGITETRHHTGSSLRHTTMALSVTGVKDALCAEVRAVDGRLQRYVYVELQEGTDPEMVAQAIRADPLFLGEDTQVFPVESLAALEQEGRGVVLDRRGSPGRFGHQHLLLEARFDETVLTAQVMLGAARALPQLEPGVSCLLDIPLNLLWGEHAEQAERRWL